MSLDANVAKAYCEWYADNVCRAITYRGVPIMKNVADLWNYQQIIVKLRPALIVEFGTASGGSALWFADLLANVNPQGSVYSVDKVDNAQRIVKEHPRVQLTMADSADASWAIKLMAAKTQYGGPIFAILDSDHGKSRVLAEMELLRDVLSKGDYLIVEDGCVNGHPIYAGWGEGPFEAIEEYERQHPYDYEHDQENERRFGFTFATNGYLVRR